MSKQIRVRMYRTGFGDCFLLTFGTAAAARHVLVDFGAHMHGEIGTMDEVMDDIEATTKKKLALLVATHRHRDHISGFGQFAERFGGFEIEEVWMPWTDDPADPDAAALNEKHLALYRTLERHLAAVKATGPEADAARAALQNLAGNEKATTELARGFGTGATVRYLKAGKSFNKVADVAGLSAEILGPPAEKTFLSRMNPPAGQHFLTGPTDTSGAARPFPGYELRAADADFQGLVVLKQPVAPEDDIKALKTAAENPASRLALFLDNVRNNTSLVIVFRYKGKALLFPGDAQWGNWQSWIGTDAARQLIAEVDFLKLSHHGSENATPVDVVNALRANGLAAMVSTQVEPFPTIPRIPLLEAVQQHCIDQILVRSDWVAVADAPKAPKAVPPLPAAFKHGDVWIDCSL
jgi:hypothetical protein